MTRPRTSVPRGNSRSAEYVTAPFGHSMFFEATRYGCPSGANAETNPSAPGPGFARNRPSSSVVVMTGRAPTPRCNWSKPETCTRARAAGFPVSA